MFTMSSSATRTRTHLSIEGESGGREPLTLGVVFGGQGSKHVVKYEENV